VEHICYINDIVINHQYHITFAILERFEEDFKRNFSAGALKKSMLVWTFARSEIRVSRLVSLKDN